MTIIFVKDDIMVSDVKCDYYLLINFNLADHIPILLDLSLSPAKNEKTELHRNLSFCKWDYVGLKENLRLNLLNPISHRN